jgi:hypothetical protein
MISINRPSIPIAFGPNPCSSARRSCSLTHTQLGHNTLHRSCNTIHGIHNLAYVSLHILDLELSILGTTLPGDICLETK